MANHTGREGVVKVSTASVAELRSWSLTETADTVDDTVMGDTWRTRLPTLKSWSGEASAWWDDTDTSGQIALAVGASVTLKFYPEGASTGDVEYSGTALVTAVNRGAQLEGMVEISFSFQGTGALAAGTVPA